VRLNRLGIRARITGGSLLIAILISIVAGVIIRNQVVHIVYDGELSVLSSIEAPYRLALTHEPTEDLDAPGADQYAVVVNPDGVLKVDSLPRALQQRLPQLLHHAEGTRTVQIGEVSYLVRLSTVATPQGDWSILAARNGSAQSSVLNGVTVLLVVALAIINLTFGAASWLIGTVALNPVNRLRRSAGQLAARPGDDLLPVGPADDEIAQLARTLNELIAELRASTDRERQIVSDASHELRTPLAILHTKLELAQSQATTLKQMRTDVASAQRTLQRLSALATALLELSRIDAQSARGSATVDELATELADAADRGRLRVGSGEVVIDFTVDVDAQGPAGRRAVAVSTHDFGRVCDNLVTNALAARPDAGRIELALHPAPSGVLLAVTDEAGGMDEAFLPHAFDRFARDTERPMAPSGAGLGLAIVSGIASVAGGRVALVNSPGEGLRVEVELPFAEPAVDTPTAKRGD
jgi:signal transduction histidine kinase